MRLPSQANDSDNGYIKDKEKNKDKDNKCWSLTLAKIGIIESSTQDSQKRVSTPRTRALVANNARSARKPERQSLITQQAKSLNVIII